MKNTHTGNRRLPQSTEANLCREGGSWLGAVRSWMQHNKLNGSDVEWGSTD